MTRAEQATVYRGAKRRYFTRAAADRSFAVEAIKRKRCDCDEPDYRDDYPGNTCDYHKDPVKFERAVHLLTVMFVRGRAET
jgi:hypothetical protein